MMTALTRRERQKLIDATLREKRGLIGFVGLGLCLLLGWALLAHERAEAPTGLAARQLFERLFDADAGNRVYDPAGRMRLLGEARTVETVTCRPHVSRRGDRAYDYDCLATLEDRGGCTVYYPFSVEHTTIGRIARPVDEAGGRAVLNRLASAIPAAARCD